MAPPASSAAPRTFPGDPNPPVQAPDVPKVAPAAAPAPTSAGTGALPPTNPAGASAPPVGASASSAHTEPPYRVIQRKDGSRDVISNPDSNDAENPPQTVGSISADSAETTDKILAPYAKGDGTYENVPPALAKALLQGKPPLPDYLASKWDEGTSMRGLIGATWLNGGLKDDEAKAQGQADLVKNQLKEAPILAWQGSVGDTVAKMWEDLGKAGISGTARRAAGEVMSAAPDLLNMGGEAAKSAGVLGVTGALVGAAVGGPAGALAGLAAGGQVGVAYGIFKHVFDVSSGNTALDMLDQGLEPSTVRTLAPLAGALNGALMDAKVNVMTASMQRAAVGKLLASKAITGVLARYVAAAGKGMALTAAQKAVSTAVTDIAARMDDRPDLTVQHPIAGMINAAITSAPVMLAMGVPGAAIEAVGGSTEPGAPNDKPLMKNLEVDENAPKVAKEGERVPAGKPAPEGKYVTNRPLDLKKLDTDKATAEDIRNEYVGAKNEQLVRGNQLVDELKRDVPDTKTRQGMFWYKAAEGDMNVLGNALHDEDLEKYHAQIETAMNLPPEARAALAKVDQYYKESGDVSKEVGTIRSIVENYQNRLYKTEDEPIRTEASASGLKQTTSHAKQRVFDTEFDAARAGKTFATTDVADALALHNGEMARVNAARKVADTMSDAGLGAWKREGNIPDGYVQVGELSKDIPLKGQDGKPLVGEDGNQVHSRSVFVAPEGIAKGLKAIVDADNWKKIDGMRGIMKFQGIVKTADLSWSLFHHLSMIAQVAYRGDVQTLLQLKNSEKFLAEPGFLERERDGALHGLVDSKVETNADILRGLSEDKEGVIGKISQLPGVKQVLAATDANANLLFGKWQRLMKVNTYSTLTANWLADHMDASNEDVIAAKRGFADHVNSVFGGQNWEAMGMTKTNLSILRTGLLAPDWTISNLKLMKQALTPEGTAGQASRAHILKSVAVGMASTEMLNMLLTGHTTDKNAPGHKLEVQMAPNVYVSMIRGGPSDILKLISMVKESGAAGVDRFAAGKLGPLARTGVGLASNTQYTGQPIVPRHYKEGSVESKIPAPIAGTYDVLKFLMANLATIPLGVSNLYQYLTDKSSKPTALGSAGVLSGVGRYSKPPRGSQ